MPVPEQKSQPHHPALRDVRVKPHKDPNPLYQCAPNPLEKQEQRPGWVLLDNQDRGHLEKAQMLCRMRKAWERSGMGWVSHLQIQSLSFQRTWRDLILILRHNLNVFLTASINKDVSCVRLSTWLELLRGFWCSLHFGTLLLSLQTGPQKHSAHTESSAQSFFLDWCAVADTEVNPSWPVWFCENPGKKKKKGKKQNSPDQLSKERLSLSFPRNSALLFPSPAKLYRIGWA